MPALPKLLHLRQPKGRPSVAPASAVPSSDDLSARAVPLDVVRRDLQSGALPPDTEVLFTGLGDWTPARDIPELWIQPPPPARASDVDPVADSEQVAASIPPSKHAGDGEGRKKGFGALAIVGAIGGAILFLLLGLGAVYLVYFHYTPVAIRHLPAKCTVAARVDFVDWAFFHPFMDRIPPAIEEATKPKVPPVGPPGPSLKERLLSQANINLDRDVREIAMCVFADAAPATTGKSDPLGGWRGVVALGGRFKRGSIPGIYEAIRGEAWASAFRLDGTGEAAVLRVAPPIGGVIGQAEDGTIIYAPDDTKLAEAREGQTEQDAMQATGLQKKGGLELVVGHVVFATAFGTVAPTAVLDAGTLDALSKIQTGHFAFVLDKNPRIEADVESRSDDDAKLTEAAVRHLLDAAQTELMTTKIDYAGEHGAISGAKVNREEKTVTIRLDFPYGDVDRGATKLSDEIKDEASPLRTKTIPFVAWKAGAGPMPPFLIPSPSTSASGSSSVPPPTGGSIPPIYDE